MNSFKGTSLMFYRIYLIKILTIKVTGSSHLATLVHLWNTEKTFCGLPSDPDRLVKT